VTTDRLSRQAPWLGLAVVLIAVGAVRVRLLEVPMERDEGEYAYGGQLLLRGEPPFAGVYNMKLPGTAVAYAAGMAVFGESTRGARAGLLVAVLATVALVFLLGRRLLGAAGALAAAAAYGTLSVSPALLGPFGHATHFVALFGTAGLLALVVALDRPGALRLAGAGVLLGLATLMKQPGAVYGAFAAAWLAWERLRRPDRSLARLALEEAALCVGAAVPLAATAAWLAAAGVLGRAWFWIVEYGRAYSGVVPLRDAPAMLGAALAAIAPPNAALAALAGVGLAAVAWRPTRPSEPGFLVGLLAASVLGVSPGFYFREHYFILALPAVALLVGAAARAIAAHGRHGRRISLAVVALACAWSGWTQRAELFQLSPGQVSRAIYGHNPFPESVEVARWIAARSGPDDRVAVLGSEPQIFFEAKRRSATGYVYVYGLMEPQTFARRMQEELIAEIERADPAYVVLVTVPTSWLVRPESDRRVFQWADAFLAARYDVVGRVAMAPDHTDYAWDAAALRPGGRHLVVFRRKGYEPPR
jgi:hypothetical protein